MSDKITKAMILAAGEGTRLRPLTLDTPKPLLPVGKDPLIIQHLRWLKSHGITQVAINLYHMGEKIQAELGDGTHLGVQIYYSPEEELLGTAGGLKKMEKLFDDTFIVLYGDILSDVNLTAVTDFHRQRKALMTLVLFRAANTWEVGIVDMDEEGRITGFTEKPPKGTETSNLSNGGIYILEPDIFTYIPEDSHYDFGFDVIPILMAEKRPVYGYPLKSDDYLIDIGTIDKYRQANEDMNAGRVKISGE